MTPHVHDYTNNTEASVGIFAGSKKIPAYTYLGVYAGEYITEIEAEKRGQ